MNKRICFLDALESRILPAILKCKRPDAAIRVWVVACSTGEEVYSLAISLLELVGGSPRPIQIFGSDISSATIATARAGVYSEVAVRDLSPECRRRYFVKTDRGYKVKKVVRDLCVFVQHDLARDPPFAKLDVVSCRNVVIPSNRRLQKEIISKCHYSLNRPGYLLLGGARKIAGRARFFSIVDKDSGIFARNAVASAPRLATDFDVRPAVPHADADYKAPHVGGPIDLGKHLDRVLLSRYAPPGVLINDKMEILQFRGQTGSYLQPAPGNPQNDIIKMARPGLRSALRAVVAQTAKEMAPVRRDGVVVDHDGFTKMCNLVAFPFTGLPGVKEASYVVLFEEAAGAGVDGAQPGHGRRHHGEGANEDRRIPRIEHELIATKEYLQSLIEEHWRANDDLGSANEELVSGNEELQSMNEELETAKEELQSTNEELTTVNDELQSRNQDVTQANSDLLNLLVTVDIPIIILDRERRIRRFTPKARRILNVLPSDHGRLMNDITTNIEVADLDRQLADVIESGTMKESEIQDRDGHWYRMQIRPYKTTDDKIDGAILSMIDIDALKHHVEQAQQARAQAERASHAKDLFLAILGHELRTPLSSLMLRGQMLRQGGVMDAAKIERIGEAIERATRVQTQLVEDLLDVSRIVAGKLKVERRAVDLAAIVRAALEGVSGLAQRKMIKIGVVIDEVGPISGDALRLQQVVSNLLTNALKFTPDEGEVSVIVDAVDGWARITVRDTGTGIDPGFLPHVFNRFSQEDTSNTRNGGLGLGLAIVRHLVEQHGGQIHAASPGIGKGATFSVSLPLMNAYVPKGDEGSIFVSTGMKAVQAPRGVAQFKNLRVLIVDDDPAIREAVAEVLTEMGAKVEVAESANAAMTVVEAFKPKVVVCDIAMPGEDGCSFIRRLRALELEDERNIPALALTAMATDDDRRRALEAGFQMHLTKPIDIDRLSEAVIELTEHRAH